jgi:hypothetical protein
MVGRGPIDNAFSPLAAEGCLEKHKRGIQDERSGWYRFSRGRNVEGRKIRHLRIIARHDLRMV